jgi:hypothetical protein
MGGSRSTRSDFSWGKACAMALSRAYLGAH